MIKQVAILLALLLAGATAYGQASNPTTRTPRLTVTPGETNVQNLVINGTCTGCPETTVPGSDNDVLRSNGAGGFQTTPGDHTINGDLVLEGDIENDGTFNITGFWVFTATTDRQLQTAQDKGLFIDGGTFTTRGLVRIERSLITPASSSSPTAITVADGTVNDLDLAANLSEEAVIYRLTSSAGSTITGLVLASGQQVTLVNVGSTNIALSYQDTGSSATNRLLRQASTTDCNIVPDGAVTLWKDPDTDRVRQISQTFNLSLCGS